MTRVNASPSNSKDTSSPEPDYQSWISYDEMINELCVKSHRRFEAWRQRLFDYLRQVGLLHVVEEEPRVPLGLNVELEERTNWIQRMVDEARVKAILLHTTPLENFKAYKDKSAYEILKQVECAASADREKRKRKRDADGSGCGEKRKRDADGAEGEQ